MPVPWLASQPCPAAPLPLPLPLRWCERSRGKPQRLADLRLDVGAMAEAAQQLVGTRDFSALMDKKKPAGGAGRWVAAAAARGGGPAALGQGGQQALQQLHWLGPLPGPTTPPLQPRHHPTPPPQAWAPRSASAPSWRP
jgi:hypothetical protein